MSDPYRYFRIEARELVDQLGQAMLGLEQADAAQAIGRILRIAHTLKGAARVVRQREIGDLAHAIEGELTPLRTTTVPVARPVVDRVLALRDEIDGRIRTIEVPPAANASATPAAAAPTPAGADTTASATIARRSRDGEEVQRIRAEVSEIDDLLDGLTTAHVEAAGLRRQLRSTEHAQQLTGALARHLGDARSGSAVRARALLRDLRAALGSIEVGLTTTVDQLDHQLREVRDATERLRLIPAELGFDALRRTARDAATVMERQVTIACSGDDVRIDAPVFTAVQEALIQLVRNAIAHGIEAPAARVAAGKPATGTISVAVVRRGRRIAITCRDDGRGIDLAAVRAEAIRRGDDRHTIEQTSDAQLLRRLLGGGISTAATVGPLAGRGVGLDVVRAAIERVGGEVELGSQLGHGTWFELSVPVTMTAVAALCVEAGGQTLTLPLDSVRRALRLRPEQVASSGDGDSLIHEGAVMPLVPLAAGLSLAARGRTGHGPVAVVVSTTAGDVALSVDRLLGARDLVFRALPSLATATPVVAGASLDSEGNPLLVLDVEALAQASRRVRAAAPPPVAAALPILVIDDSLTTRMLEQSILESAGYEVDTATSAEEGMTKALARRYGLFLVDVDMPGMNGFEFVAQTRAHPELRVVPAILVTSRNEPEDRRRGQEVGAADYVVKSEFDQVALLARIAGLVKS